MLGPLLDVEMSKKRIPLWHEAHFEVKMHETHQVRTTFGSWDVEKVHAVVVRSTFRSQNVKSTRGYFWRLRCRKSARRCRAKHISKSKCTKHTRSGPLLEVGMLKECTPLWRKAHFEPKMWKTPGFGPRLDAQMSFRVAGARDCAPCPKWAKRESFVAFSSTNTTALHYTPIHYTKTTTTPSLHSTTLYTTLHSTTLHSTTLHYIPLRYTTLHYTTLITLHYTRLDYTPLHYTTLHYTSLHCTPLHYSTLHSITLHYTTPHHTTLH